MTDEKRIERLTRQLKLDELKAERDSLKIDLDQASLYLRSSELSERVLESERDSLSRQVKIAVDALEDEIQREAVHGNQAPHVTARHARLSRVMAEIEAAKGVSGER